MNDVLKKLIEPIEVIEPFAFGAELKGDTRVVTCDTGFACKVGKEEI
jgi:hypothetical protein